MNYLTLRDVERVAIEGESFVLDEKTRKKISDSFYFLKEFSADKVIYGINTGFGPMAQFKIESDQLEQLQYNLIRSHSSGVGRVVNDQETRAILLARLNSFAQGNSGVSLETVEQIERFLQMNILPEIYEHGGVGASGDLVQLAHLALTLIGEGTIRHEGKRILTADFFQQHAIIPLKLQLRDGLALINGTSCMTGIAAVNLIYAKRLMNWALVLSTIMNELVESFSDSFSEELNKVKYHAGQAIIAQQMRKHLADSTLIQDREPFLRQTEAIKQRVFQKKIQEYYSLRCVPQIIGPIYDTLAYAQQIIEQEINSTNDNPIVDRAANYVFHGGNFHGDYIAFEMDKVKIAIAKLTMLVERQLNFLLNSKLNDLFPPFLNAKKLGLNFGLQGLQFVATSTTAENQMLANPMYIHSIPSNNDNQDIVSMGTNSAVITRKVIENGFQVIAIQTLAICQAIDFLPKEKQLKMATKTKNIYEYIRQITPQITDDKPQFDIIQKIIDLKTNSNWNKLIYLSEE